MVEWAKTIWRRRPKKLGKRSMLVLDAFSAHKGTNFLQELGLNDTDILNIPGGITSISQPLDVSINKPFKDRVKHYWRTWMVNRIDPKATVSRQLIAEWVKQAWEAIPTEIIIRSFKKTGISNKLDGSEDDLLSAEVGEGSDVIDDEYDEEIVEGTGIVADQPNVSLIAQLCASI